MRRHDRGTTTAGDAESASLPSLIETLGGDSVSVSEYGSLLTATRELGEHDEIDSFMDVRGRHTSRNTERKFPSPVGVASGRAPSNDCGYGSGLERLLREAKRSGLSNYVDSNNTTAGDDGGGQDGISDILEMAQRLEESCSLRSDDYFRDAGGGDHSSIFSNVHGVDPDGDHSAGDPSERFEDLGTDPDGEGDEDESGCEYYRRSSDSYDMLYRIHRKVNNEETQNDGLHNQREDFSRSENGAGRHDKCSGRAYAHADGGYRRGEDLTRSENGGDWEYKSSIHGHAQASAEPIKAGWERSRGDFSRSDVGADMYFRGHDHTGEDDDDSEPYRRCRTDPRESGYCNYERQEFISRSETGAEFRYGSRRREPASCRADDAMYPKPVGFHSKGGSSAQRNTGGSRVESGNEFGAGSRSGHRIREYTDRGGGERPLQGSSRGRGRSSDQARHTQQRHGRDLRARSRSGRRCDYDDASSSSSRYTSQNEDDASREYYPSEDDYEDEGEATEVLSVAEAVRMLNERSRAERVASAAAGALRGRIVRSKFLSSQLG